VTAAEARALVEAALREPWEDLDRQREAASFGMWVFLASEILFFSGLFLAYVVYRGLYQGAIIEAARHADFFYGTLNTAILMTSSLTLVLAARGAEAGFRRFALWCLAATIALGLGFVVVKGLEYAKDIEDHLLVAYNFDLKPPGTVLFWSFYWVATGLHAVHVTIGIALISRLLIQGLRSALPLQTTPQVEATALYWHLVDIIWIFLYPCIYLVGRAS
jgi:cytochrome c oxidase subunit 3